MEPIEVESETAMRLRCVRQIVDADEPTLQLVSSVLDRVLPQPQKTERKRRTRRQHGDEKGGAE